LLLSAGPFAAPLGAHLAALAPTMTSNAGPNPSPAPKNHPPVLVAPGNQTIAEGSELHLTLQASDPDPGQRLTFSLVGQVPPGASIDPVTGLFTWTPGHGPTSVEVTVRVTDNGSPNLFTEQTFTIFVQNVASLVQAGNDAQIDPGAQFTQSGTFTDPG